ncbi:septum formation family protein [Micromonospora sp. R77]|uniref:septum formation family protein n=1 Tax=Micromonospora sp. R77 TaxID=2925836 RepID=UPI001F61F26A|nr:septum formation family protein [Micromonospora sp. R77]MCI4065472.1 septum formation family protein [Micromonospora sp. R77]
MRRWWTAVVLGTTAALALAGCGTPTGVDRDVADDWPALGPAKSFLPANGVCHSTVQDIGYLTGYNPVDCTGPHRAETLHVGTLTGMDANRGAPPRPASTGMRKAAAECDRQVSRAVGADWRTGRLHVTVIFPSTQAWSGGARWFRCDVSETVSLDDFGVSPRTTSLRNALAAGSPLAYGCFNPKVVKEDIDEMRPAACTAKHHAEFVGVWQAPDVPYATFAKSRQRTHQACRSLIAKYVKVPDNSDMQYRAGTIMYHPYEEEWNNGNHGVQCFLWLDDRTLTRSVAGGGSKALPVQ